MNNKSLFLVACLGLLHSVKGDELLKMRMLIAERGIQLCKQQSDKVILFIKCEGRNTTSRHKRKDNYLLD